MRWLYNLGILGYYLLLKIVSIRNEKARKWIEGRKDIFNRLRETITPGERILWFHASSLGEFEQGRPVIESIRKLKPEYKILLTFFSPSGYELRKDYKYADYIFYLPLDTKKNAARFIDIVRPEKVFFIKYEFWYNYLTQLKEEGIPTYIFSALFRPSQIFFKPWGKWYLKAIGTYEHIFVQNQESFDILHKFGFINVSLSGDTRLDRVGEIADAAPRLDKLEIFCGGQKAIIAGSTWKEDEDLFLPYVNKCQLGQKFVIAPHEVTPQSLERVCSALGKPYALYSTASPEELTNAEVLIVDGYGYLVSVYRYGMFAYVGGGFTSGIHSTLEPAAFGLPVIFGPDYQKFQEAHDMLSLGAATCINNFEELELQIDSYRANPEKLLYDSAIARGYVNKNRGASKEIVKYLFL
ncbi:MAG TPA: glycosyltransferase N-terminal domain-containing protein [Prolixibacteraceae bacterium]|nr:glycosyltransferase N-terminal domain-containing protein [Prolixibacteraceae bacterium]